ncbi:MAG TPA: xanthine dehydrogenase family protein molybdopterin-binding subunit [Nitrolancea sp.]|nr:xanthine dehydrogenase family protein molybdopterin-binding subunit [Nitrolancea sp.]
MAVVVPSELVGSRIRRKEDPRLITGSSTYVDDFRLPGTLHLAFVRSIYAHARINGIDTAAALAMPGVAAILTGKELDDYFQSRSGAPVPEPGTPRAEVLAIDIVRYLGQPLVAVVADSQYTARDAADAVVVDYDPLPTVTTIEAASKEGAPLIWTGAAGNVGVSGEVIKGDAADAFAKAEIVVKERILSQKLAGVPMEGRAVLVAPDPMTGGLTMWTSTQAAHGVRSAIAKKLALNESQVRAIAPEVGGAFGVKIGAYQEDYVATALALKLKRPIKWIETRSENFQVTNHGRAQIADIEMAAEKNGKILAYRLNVVQDLGAYPKGTFLPGTTGSMAVGCYDIPVVDIHTSGIYTNTMGVGAYRGAGRPEAAYYIERAIDLLAAKAGLDPIEVRKINFIDPGSFPYVTATGVRYDTGEYSKSLTKALETAGYAQLRAHQEELRQQGRYIGIGLATYVEICGFGPWESSTVRVEPSGDVSVFTGISPHGQGQETSFAQIVSDRLGVAFDRIVVYHGDTNNTPQGKGTMGSRGLAIGGSAVVMSTDKIRDKARHLVASILEASYDDIELAGGKYRVKGAPDRAVTMDQIAAVAYGGKVPAELEPGLESTDFFRPEDATFPFGTHIAIVEVLPETGEVKLLRYVSIDDCGFIVSPLLVEGQVHGGLAQGIAQALLEEIHYDENGQLLTGTLMDYAIPKADRFPMFETGHTETRTPLNPLGAKGIGEAATIGSTPSVANAVMDALAPFGITHLDVPLTPQKIWNAIQSQA